MTTIGNPTIVDLASTTLGAAEIGGKAAGLARLAATGFPVPDGAVVPAGTGDADLDRAAELLAARYRGRSLAVRSSGVAEDGAGASFAGQYETVLDVPADPEPIADALRRVRTSVAAPHVAAYGHGGDRRMAVLVMPMVDATAAGIAFTRDPVTGERTVVLEAVAGLADRLAAGEQGGERWRIADEPACDVGLGVLTPGQAAAVADLARRVEDELGTPVDVEWAMSGGEIVLLQARPITTVDDVEPVPYDEEIPPGPWEWDASHNRMPLTPMAASLFPLGFEEGSRRLVELFGAPFAKLAMTTINGYLYIQVVPPAGKPGQPAPPAPVMKALFRLLPPLRRREKTARRALAERTDRVLAEQWRSEIRPVIEEKLDAWWSLDPVTLDDTSLQAHLAETAEIQKLAFSWTVITDPSYLLPLADLHDFVQRELGEGMECVTRLLAGSSRSEYRVSLRSLEERLTPELRTVILDGAGDVLGRLEETDPGFAAAYREHLRAHGARILGFQLVVPTLMEDPQTELSRLVSLPSDADPSIEAEGYAAEMRSRLTPDAAVRFDELVAEARKTYPIREEGEAVHARAIGTVRRAALAVGHRMVEKGHLERNDHVFFLSLSEAGEWLQEPGDRRALVRKRRANHLWALGHSPAPTVGGNPLPPDPSAFPPGVGRITELFRLVVTHDLSPTRPAAGEDGVAASPGVYTGPVRIVRGPEDFHRVHPGDVLVAPLTTSPWEVLFPTIGALVTEGGGLLSHPAIVAREYRLPAVVGCEGATSRFRDGQLVTVDGSAGRVTPVEGTGR